MVKYEHGITIIEKPSALPVRQTSTSQVAVGTAPVHLLEDPSAAVNKPIVAYTMEDVRTKVGYSENFEDYTLSEVAFASFELIQVAPVVFINVLNPEIHKKTVGDSPIPLTKGNGVINAEGVLLKTVVVKNSEGTTTYEKNKDYTIAFDNSGKPVISSLPGGTMGAASTVSVSFNQLDPSAVTAEDIIGGYNSETGAYSGIELVRQVFPQFGIVPNVLLAPGWSHIPEVGAILNVKNVKINGNFNATSILDLDSSSVTRFEDAATWKEENNYVAQRSIALWPKVKTGKKVLWFSSIVGALMCRTDADNENVPSLSPSNKLIPISATVLADGKEVFLDQPQANYLNGQGIMTALNWSGWRTWGNNTSIYPLSTDPKDRFIMVRRTLDWWANSFLLEYFKRVDDPLNFRLIESVIDSENVRANGYAARGHISGATIEFRQDMNSTEDILNGKMTVLQRVGTYTPAEHIVNVLEFDPTFTYAALSGGDQQ